MNLVYQIIRRTLVECCLDDGISKKRSVSWRHKLKKSECISPISLTSDQQQQQQHPHEEIPPTVASAVLEKNTHSTKYYTILAFAVGEKKTSTVCNKCTGGIIVASYAFPRHQLLTTTVCI